MPHSFTSALSLSSIGSRQAYSLYCMQVVLALLFGYFLAGVTRWDGERVRHGRRPVWARMSPPLRESSVLYSRSRSHSRRSL